MKYHIWTEGCQMNVADSQRVASALEQLGYLAEADIEQADVMVLNTCVVRQSAEDKAYGRLTSLLPHQAAPPRHGHQPDGLHGGRRGAEKLREKLPCVDVFSPPSEPGPLVRFLPERDGRDCRPPRPPSALPIRTKSPASSTRTVQTWCCPPPSAAAWSPPMCRSSTAARTPAPSASSPSGAASNARGPSARSSAEVRSLAAQGVKEVTLLGQIVDRYGKDIPDGPNLAATCCASIHEVEGMERIRFLTSHPNYMTDELLETVAELPKVMRAHRGARCRPATTRCWQT